jgi:hypothetical protein
VNRRLLVIDADFYIVLQKKVINKLFQQTPMTRSDVGQIRTDIEWLKAQISSRIQRIPKRQIPLCGGDASTQGKNDSTSMLNKWCRMTLSAIFDQFWSLLYLPLCNSNIGTVWSELRQR